MRPAFPLILFLAFGCASMNQPPTPGRPAIYLTQQNALFFGSGGTATLGVGVEITNVSAEPITVRRVRLHAGPLMTQYSTYPAERVLHQTIAPGETESVDMVVTAHTEYARLDATEPLSLRAVLDFERGGKRFNEIYIVTSVSR